MMPYWLRITLGALLGLLVAIPLWLFVGIAWLTATLAALLAAIGFLGSYFVWSADRPEEGYEQVLFDRPNTIVSAALIVVFAIAGIGTGFLGGDPPPSTAERVGMLFNAYQNNADAFANDELDAGNFTSTLDELRIESDRLAIEIEEVPDDEVRDALVAANDALALAMDSMKACAAGDQDQCMDARLSAADARSALERLRG